MARKRSKKDPRRSRRANGLPGPPVVAMVSLGCPKNTVDSERVLGMLAERGFLISADPDYADVVLVNTCAFIEPARQETEEVLRSLGLGRDGPAVVALGCYPERVSGRKRGRPYRHSDLPGVDAFVGFESYDQLPGLCADLAGAVRGDGEGPPPRSRFASACFASACFASSPRLRLGSPATAYLKIAEGCSNRCRYCAIPRIRGPLRSIPMEELLDEAEGLVSLGAGELCVIAQDTASYGTDLHGRPRLAELLRRLCEIEGLRWVRLLYVHPAHLTDEILEAMAGEKKVCRYLDLPVQHASTRILGAMGRRYAAADVRRLLEAARSSLPGLAIRTSIIVGFPGESPADFDELMGFVEETGFEHLGVFTYSREEGTPAARLEGQVSAVAAARRRGRLMRLQQGIAFGKLDARVGGVETVMLELPGKGPGEWLARTEREAPEVDGFLQVRLPRGTGAKRTEAKPGSFLRVKIGSRSGYDLIAAPSG